MDVAIFLAGLYLLLKDLIPWLNSQRTGETRTRAYNSQLVRRAEDPHRFEALQKNRTDGIVVGLLVIGVAVALRYLGLLSLVLLVPIGVIMATSQSRKRKRMKAVVDEFN